MGERMTAADLDAIMARRESTLNFGPGGRELVETDVPRLVAEVRARDTELAATRASEARLVVELAQRDTVIEAVRKLHVPEDKHPDTCRECSSPTVWVGYPCATIRALGGDQ